MKIKNLRRLACLAILFLLSGNTYSAVYEENKLQIVMTPDFFPIIWYDAQKYGVDFTYVSSQVLSCNGVCMIDAINAGASTYRVFQLDQYRAVTVYYDRTGKILGTSIIGDTPLPAPLPATNTNSSFVDNSPQQGALTDYVTGNTPVQTQVTEDGAFEFTIPLELPSGANGNQPKLNITYNSKNPNGLLGQGISVIGLSSITRCPAKMALDGYKGTTNFDANDRFCLDGQRLVSVSGTYGANGTEYRTEIDSFLRIYSRGQTGSGPTYFEVETKSGNSLQYGASTDSAIRANGRTEFKRWAINKNTDRYGNYIEYRYAGYYNSYSNCSVQNLGQGEYVPCQIDYSYNLNAGLTAPFASIKFGYEERPDAQVGYIGNTIENRSKRINNIGVYLEGLNIKNYRMYYKSNQANNSSQLTDLKECDGASIEKCKRPLHFNWSNTTLSPIVSNQLKLTRDNLSVNNSMPMGDGIVSVSPSGNNNVINGDFNADNITDIILIGIDGVTNKYCSGPGLTLSNNCIALTLIGVSTTKGADVQIGDYNGDGVEDLYILGNKANTSYYCRGPVNVSVSGSASMACNVSPLTNPLVLSSTVNPNSATVYVPTYKIHTADINGDGHDDLMFLALGTSKAMFTRAESETYKPDFETYKPRTSMLCTDVSLGGQSYYQTGANNPTTGGGCTTINASKNSAWAVTGTIGVLPSNVEAFAPVISDFDGDGFEDLFLIRSSTNSLFCKGSPQGLVDSCISVPSGGWSSQFMGQIFGLTPVGDFNGDGYKDFLFLKYNNVSGTTTDISGTTTGIFCPGPVGVSDYSKCVDVVNFDDLVYKSVPSDYNGDGRTDVFIQSFTKQYFCDSSVFVIGGSCVDVTSNIIPVTEQTFTGVSGFQFKNTFINLGIFPGDYNGDGNIDLYMAGPSSSFFAEGIDSGKFITKVTDSVGKASFIEYTTLANPEVYDNSQLTTNDGVAIHAPMQVVSKYKVSNSEGALNEYTYKYSGARYNIDRGYLGFSTRGTTDAQRNTVTTDSYRQDYPFIGALKNRTVKTTGNQTIDKSTNNHQAIATYNGKIQLPYPYFQTIENYDLSTGVKYLTTTVTKTLDDFGNLTNQVKTITDNLTSESFTTTTVNTFAYKASTNWKIKGLLTHTDVTKSGAQGLSATVSQDYEYDNISSPSVPTIGFLTKETVAKGTNTELNKSYTPDGFGNVATATFSPRAGLATTDPAYFAPRVTTTVYEAKGRFPFTATNSKSQVDTYIFDPRFGVKTDVFAADTTHTHWDYDTFGQQTAMTRPDGTRQALQREWNTSTHVENMLTGTGGSGHNSRYKVTTREYAVDGITEYLSPVTNFYNVTGDVIRVVSKGFDGADVYTDANYDALGRKYATSRPYYATDITSKYPTHIHYDELNRVVQTDDPAGVITTNTYNGFTTITNKAFDGKNQSTVMVSNALGQPKSVTDANLKTLNYTYVNSLTGRIERITDPANNIIEMEYDVLGRKVRMQDPDMGSWTYGYNALGEQKWIRSPNNAAGGSLYTNWFEYDTLGRVKTRTDYKPDGAVENISTWNYDTQLAGKLGSVVTTPTDNFSRIFTYDTLGRVDTITSRVMATDYMVDYGYSPDDGRLKTVKYPTGFEVQNNYNSAGYLNQVVNAANPATVYWQGNATTADGQFSNTDYGNGVNIIRGFKPESGRVDFIDADVNGNMLQHNSYAFDGIGNLVSRNDMLNNHVETFGYDALNRLQTNTLDGAATTTMVYDDLGNITTMPGVGTYTYKTTTTRPHAVENIAGTLTSSFAYDANGNMQSGNNRTITWTSFDKPRQITRTNNGSVFANFGYDAEFNRTVQTFNTGTTVYLNPSTTAGAHFERYWAAGDTVPENRHYIYAGDKLIALYTTKASVADETQYFLKDHLGSTEVVTDSTGGVIERLSYAAFGNKRDTSSWLNPAQPIIAQSTTRGYTGHEQLDELGLVHMNGRLYDPQIGRFISADPYIQSPGNLQSFNRYSYVMNNPLSFTDPTGYVSEGYDDLGSPYNYDLSGSSSSGSNSTWSMFDNSTSYSSPTFGYSSTYTNTYTNLNFSPLDYSSLSQNTPLFGVPAGTYGLSGDNYSNFNMFAGLGTTAVLGDFAAQGGRIGLGGVLSGTGVTAVGVTALGVGSVVLTLRGDTPEGVYLFRVVDDIELGRVMKTQEFSGVSPSGREGKEFWLNIVDARSFAEKQFKMSDAFGNVPRTILQAQTSSDILRLGYMFQDAGNNNAVEIYFPSYVMPQVNSDIRAHGGIIMRDRYDAR